MRADNQERSSKQRLNDFLGNICPPKIAQNDNDNPIEKSRWAKWQFTRGGAGNKVEFHQVEKSESKIINRLLDRLDPSAGKARHAARLEIIKLLETNGIEITNDIKKYLPDTRKLGNINALGESIQTAISKKENQRSEDLKKFKGFIEEHVSSVILQGQLNCFLRTSSDDVYQQSKKILESEFKSVLTDFSEKLPNEISLLEKSLSKDEFTEFINEHFEKLYNEIAESDNWKSIRSTIFSSIESKLKIMEYENKISAEEKIKVQNELDKLLDNSLMFSGLLLLLSKSIIDNKKDFVNLIKKKVSGANDGTKADDIFLNVVGGFAIFLKNKARKK